jgi:hypothetical protein
MMNEKTDLIHIYTGTEINVALLKTELEKVGVIPMLRDEFASGVASGFFAGSPSNIDVYIQPEDLPVAKPVVEGFLELTKGNGNESSFTI